MVAIVASAVVGVGEGQGPATRHGDDEDLHSNERGAVGVDHGWLARDIPVVEAAALKLLLRTGVDGNHEDLQANLLFKLRHKNISVKQHCPAPPISLYSVCVCVCVCVCACVRACMRACMHACVHTHFLHRYTWALVYIMR